MKIRSIISSDIPQVVQLGEREFKSVFPHRSDFYHEYCRDYCLHSINHPEMIIFVALDPDENPVGYLAGGCDRLYLGREIEAVVHHWYVAPEHQGGQSTVGLELLNAFENWAKTLKGASRVVVGITQKKGSERYLNRIFNRMGYDLGIVHYIKEI